MTDMSHTRPGGFAQAAALAPVRFTAPTALPPKAQPESPIYARAGETFNDAHYAHPAPPLSLGARDMTVPEGIPDLCYIRLPIKRPGSEEFTLPPELAFLQPLIEECAAYQKAYFPDFKGRHADLILRTGLKGSVNQKVGEFHANDIEDIYFSKPLPHQSYFWTSSHPVLYSAQAYPPIPQGATADDLTDYFNAQTDKNAAHSMNPRNLHVIDNYHVHAKPPVPEGTHRTMIRICFAPYADPVPGATPNPWLP